MPVKNILRKLASFDVPNVNKQFKLYVDTSDIGVGTILLQEDLSGVDYYS